MANDDEIPWYAPGDAASQQGPLSTRRPRERLWTLTKRTKRVDAELLFHGGAMAGECQCLYDGELVYGRRFVMKEGAVAEAAAQRQRLIAEGWTLPLTSRPADAVEESSCVRLQ
jgi:hypothetical protein